MENLKPKDAAEQIGISYPTIKQWIYSGKIMSIRTAGGHHRIPSREVERLSGHEAARPIADDDRGLHNDPISVRNRITGTVTSVDIQGLFAEVTVDVGGQQIVSIITRRGCEEMGLKPGMRVHALFKATEVMIGR
ncbi:MAG: helix-turn-helix transcriptional regulator [Acidobacteriota bacterium]|mgnify:CR=1 FL=1